MRKVGLVVLAAALLAAACDGAASSARPQPSGLAQSSASPGTTQVAQLPATTEIETLVASMQAAVRDRDRAAYLDLVDQSDPVFALEHTRLVADWAGPNPVDDYTLALADLAIAGEAATGRLTAAWSIQGQEPRAATFAVRFTNDGSRWRYAGEEWVATDAPRFRILVQPGLELAVPAIVADLPGIYEHVTTALGYEPAASMQIKLYADAEALVANTLLSLPPIRGWNEPGEALKLRFELDVPAAPTIAHEFSHFVGFDRAGTRRSLMPWWLDEGVATFVAGAYDTPGRGDERLAQVAAWEAENQLADWSDMSVFEETPQTLWQFVYPQGYAMVRYVTETYGDQERNAWLALMATEQTIDTATPDALGVSFDALDPGFRAWLAAR